jgi:predicted ester cyclase
MHQEEKRATIERIYDAFNRRALDELDGLFHPDYVDHSPQGEIRGVPMFREYLKSWLDAFPDGRFELSHVIVEEDLAAWQSHFTGTNTGSLMGMPPTGRRVQTRGVDMGRMSDDGRALEHWSGNEMGELMQQLGLMPEAAEAPA